MSRIRDKAPFNSYHGIYKYKNLPSLVNLFSRNPKNNPKFSGFCILNGVGFLQL